MGGFAGKRYWLVGGSDGLGLALARQMRAEGADLVISARNAKRLASVCAELGAEALPMDMADAASVAQAAGHVVLTGSLAGYRGLPGAMGYAASKGGAMVLAESLYADLRGSGVKVQLANPGFIETRLTAQNSFSMPFIMTPEKAAGHMMRLMRSNRFKSSFPAPFSWLFRYGQGLPDWLWYRMFPRG